ncbi:MAG TPA: tRNA (guanosine(37)-N1)-methyltransferase TrmD [Bacillota bacterium]|jgi:tRNA (guanine37-N1)-methyltransferase|nr:tRNA (guanosine(37)-N1)-methyltransferase TrmD [Bacillota bacterium]HOB86261.1 tRNA (guanosine(37)-N1)-methyltransferase TrmD [Bacillota bacterium]HOP68789.1 tRNA (guanosine(37)-N1)-methyltransferase TrmD [Bacillota bacterium]HPT33844.1 tRNA (guanosine(37)-N1)-methyltransferase TrmD [Bacillota bacterium]HPZ65372.1 tRNA (guanosine(37)-N1)-methyltransferase TrmD [Bacillota bacterium]
MKIDVVTIFPQMFQGPFQESMVKRAVDRGLVEIRLVNLRDFAPGKHRQVDDAPYGGGKGMIFKPEPLFRAVEALKEQSGGRPRVILMSPRGRLFNQDLARELAAQEHLIFLCGHYEGVDERVRLALVDDEISIGDYILTGGELAAMVVIDAVVRLQPGLLDEEAVQEESFNSGLLEYPQYTRPPVYRGLEVPPVLLSGNHGEIARWRRRQALKLTWERRRDLLKKANLLAEDRAYLEQLEKENQG